MVLKLIYKRTEVDIVVGSTVKCIYKDREGFWMIVTEIHDQHFIAIADNILMSTEKKRFKFKYNDIVDVV